MSKMSRSDSGDKTDIPDGDGSWSQRSTTCSNHLAPLSVPYAFASTKMGVLFLLSCGFRPIAEGGSQSIAVNKQVSLAKSCSHNLSHRDVSIGLQAMRLAILTCAIVLIGAATGAQAATKGKPLDDAQCKATWTIVSPNGAAISKDKPVPSIIDWTMVDTNKDAMIDADEFKAGCAAGWIAAAS